MVGDIISLIAPLKKFGSCANLWRPAGGQKLGVYFCVHSLQSILGDPGADSRDGTKIGTGESLQAQVGEPPCILGDPGPDSRQSVPESPRMSPVERINLNLDLSDLNEI